MRKEMSTQDKEKRHNTYWLGEVSIANNNLTHSNAIENCCAAKAREKFSTTTTRKLLREGEKNAF